MERRSLIEQIALEPVCDADFVPNSCTAGLHTLEIDLWLAIQAGKCECVTFETNPRTLRLYFNENPLVSIEESLPQKYSPVLSLAALSSVILACFFYVSIWFKRKVDRRRLVSRQIRGHRRRVVVQEVPIQEQSVIVEEIPDSPARGPRALEIT